MSAFLGQVFEMVPVADSDVNRRTIALRRRYPGDSTTAVSLWSLFKLLAAAEKAATAPGGTAVA